MSWKVLQRIFFSLCVILWGAVMLYFYVGPNLGKYLDPKFHFTVLVGGLACCVLGAFNLLMCRKETSCGHGGDCGHDHEETDLNPIVALLILLVPILASLNWTEHKIDERITDKKSAMDVDPASMRYLADLPPFTRETLDDTRDKSADGFYQMNLLELFYSAGDPDLERVFTGLNFETEAILRDEPNRNESGKRMRLYRMFMTCCAADMKAIPISIEFDGELPQIEKNSWVKVGGEMYYERLDGVVYPVLKVRRIEEIEPPFEEQMYK
ncbi:TIGR03943 family protein [Rubritalea squalenifaciens DSM 18772]|uniref:TIGR03943 family protein n=2 Tax=Rubritalea TaxID=361050 RepID=A0A1M6ISY6_9BACT|nr:DUF1980 domain-containing protein [Rubritalea squalenifaciens]SHJ37581.1 TIGR03943 family protein [Rubritalea squalenifaciens DSM 18772]